MGIIIHQTIRGGSVVGETIIGTGPGGGGGHFSSAAPPPTPLHSFGPEPSVGLGRPPASFSTSLSHSLIPVPSVIITTSSPSLSSTVHTRSLLPPRFTTVSDFRTSDTSTSVSLSGLPQQENSPQPTSGPQNTGTPVPNPISTPAAPSSSSNRTTVKHGTNFKIIAPICIAILAVLLLSGVLYFKVTRKRWPFAGNWGQRVVLEPYQIERVNQAATTRNQLLSGDFGLGNSSRESTGNTQRGHPLVRHHQLTSSSGVSIPREQLEIHYATLRREVESIQQLLTVGTQSTQHAGQPWNDEPPDYSSQVELAETRPLAAGVTQEKIRNS